MNAFISGDPDSDGATLPLVDSRRWFSPSINLSALRRASFSSLASFSSSSVSERLIRSLATILFASSNNAWDNDSSSASNFSFSVFASLCAPRSRCNSAVKDSTSLERWRNCDGGGVVILPGGKTGEGVPGRLPCREFEFELENRSLKNRLS